MTDLLAPLNDDKMVLLRCISGPLAEQGQYPIWQYVEAELDRQDLDAREVLRSLPLAGVLAPGALYYGPIAGDLTLTDDSRLRLTVAGFYQLPEFRERVGQFFIRLLNLLIERRKFARLTPFEVSRVEVTGKEINREFPSTSPFLQQITFELLENEPATWGGSRWTSADRAEWSLTIRRNILEYQGLTSVSDYLVRVTELFTPPKSAPEPVIASPMDLVASLKYLNTVWELHFGSKIMGAFDPERTARLVFGVASADEFSSQVSTLAELVKTLRVSGDPTLHKTGLARLDATLKAELPIDAHARVSAATTILGNIAKVRNALFQHSGTEHRGLQALRDLGISYPVDDWDAAWRIVERRMIEALHALREELQQFHESSAADT